MIGMIRVSDMKSEAVYCKPESTAIEFVVKGLNDNFRDYVPCLPIGIFKGDKLIGGVLINDIRAGVDCWLTIYTSTPKWATRRVLRYVFGIVFNLIEARRCSVFISESNKKSLDMCLRLGFVKEGFLRQYRDNGENCYVLGMLKRECIWL